MAQEVGKRIGILLCSAAVFVALAVPANAQDDTTPPQLQALSLSTNVIDTSSGPQVVTVTATVTDDVSGVASAHIVFDSPSGSAYVSVSPILVSGDTYVGDLTFPQFSPQGIWTVYAFFQDNAGNYGNVSNIAMQQRGINVVIGNGSFESVYPREIFRLFGPSKKSVGGKVEAEANACEDGTSVKLQRKRSDGWKTFEETWLESRNFDFNHLSLKPGVGYRVYIQSFGLGTPVLTTCGKTVQKFKLES